MLILAYNSDGVILMVSSVHHKVSQDQTMNADY